MQKYFTFLIIFCFVYLLRANILIPPINPTTSLPEYALIFVQGADIPIDRYIPLCTKIQLKLPQYRLWISIPKTILDLPFDLTADLAINKAISELKSKNFNGKLFIAGHSLGGIAAGDWGTSHPDQIAGVIQLGSFLQRNQRNLEINTPILMIGGELDGLSRITRFAEEFYNRNYKKNIHDFVQISPIIVLKGVNHMHFASGEPSFFVKQRDLKAENNEEVSHDIIAEVIANFISGNTDFIIQKCLETEKLLKPIIEAFELEGSIHFNRPDQENCKQGYCSIGSPWSVRAQEIISQKDLFIKAKIKLNITNDYVKLSSLPPFGKLYHPKIYKNGSVVSIPTYSQGSWDLGDKYIDGGFSPISAKEIGSKLLTRQCSLILGLGLPKNENPIEKDNNLCLEINKEAFNIAIGLSDITTKERFVKYGQKLSFEDDIIETNGFGFVYTTLKMDENEKGELVIKSPSLVTDIDVKPVPIFAPDGANCYHYCKLLSPARALEWIYVDGLRKNYHI